MNNVEIAERFGKMWRKSRMDAGKSQDYLAKALGISKKTIQNWEAGYSSPSQLMGFKWFEALDVSPLPYYLQLLFDSQDEESDEGIKDALITLINNLSADEIKKLSYLLCGNHSSSPRALMELMIAYVQTPLPARIGVAQLILTNYNISRQNGSIEPNKSLLGKSIANGMKSVEMGKNTYVGGMLE